MLQYKIELSPGRVQTSPIGKDGENEPPADQAGTADKKQVTQAPTSAEESEGTKKKASSRWWSQIPVPPLDKDAKGDAILEEWLRCQQAARLEKQWMHERLSWLFTPQSILFAALGLTFSDKFQSEHQAITVVRWVISWVAILNCAVVLLAVFAACFMHSAWTRRMKKYAKAYPGSEGHRGHLTFGSEPQWPARLARYLAAVLPLIFLLGWVAIMVGTCGFRSERSPSQPSPQSVSRDGGATDA
jgi:cytochrome c oxidase subunit IV